MQMTIYTIIGLVAIVGYYVGLGAKRVRLPSLIGYMLVGVVLGVSGLDWLGEARLEHLDFITEIALGFVAFSIGMELSLVSLREQGFGIISIIFAESFAAFLVVVGAIYVFTRDLPLALVFGAMAPASAPAGTVAVIQETRSKGSLTKALYAVVGFDDGLAIIIFGFAAALAKSLLMSEHTGTGASLMPGILEAGKEIVLSIVVGTLIGFVFCQLVRFVRESKDVLILAFGAILIGIGFSVQWHLSLILTNMVVGFVLVNTRKAEVVHNVGRQMLHVMPLLFLLFFVLAGAHLDISALGSLGLIGVVYIIGRSAGLVGGSRLGALFGKVEPKIKNYIGLGILSQAGVAIGLSLIVRSEFAELGSQHAEHIAMSVLATITATCIFFELIGPILTKYALGKAGEIPEE
jgi:Kef-type K+ transport system membrane component KefB